LPSIIKNISINSFGVAVPFIVIAAPYVLQNKFKLFVDSVFMATLEYGHTTKVTLLHKLSVAAWIICFALLVSALALKFADKEKRKEVGLFITLLAATIFTFYSSGTVNGHYLIQVYPFILILLFGFTLKIEFKSGYWKYALFVLLLCAESYLEYYRIIKNYNQNSTLYNGKAFESISQLKRLNLQDKKIFFADHHIGYWFLNEYPLAKSVTHPSSLSRPAFFKHFGNTRTSLEELKYIIEEIKPEVIVSRKECLSFFDETSEENLYFKSMMKNYFQLVYKDPESKIFIWAKNTEPERSLIEAKQ